MELGFWDFWRFFGFNWETITLLVIGIIQSYLAYIALKYKDSISVNQHFIKKPENTEYNDKQYDGNPIVPIKASGYPCTETKAEHKPTANPKETLSGFIRFAISHHKRIISKAGCKNNQD